MSVKTEAAPRAIGSYSVSLQQAAAALWDGNFWGREKINPEPPLKRPLSAASARSPSIA
ncbi:hypothetical protein ACFSCW_03650 [Sphingomonas tabacisoli]|uniref:Uncharacterized protein n=1 Tax=Sphingomonas tabacisoli TaxID=2249466 RepID=A0ABW4I0E1_9SPHN